MESRQLDKIIKDCIKGKAKAQELLYVTFAPKMLGVCLRYSKDLAEAEDTLQDGFIKIFQNVKSYQFKGSFEGWMRRVMVNTALAKFRQEKKIQLVEEVVDIEDEEDENYAESEISIDILLKMVQELPDRYRMVFSLYVLDGYPHNEIAEVMEITVGTSKSNLARGRAILKQKVKEYLEVKQNNLRVC
ncbi:sigma-70 family RNA polymerase sigma factor [Labilibaculum sp. DW002]|uniref:Sigma-70 family RNA polymerase sigma factor n=1 Tax=Paralabilibaculum antarcticum TaxID=2912572 RepID=A0ABT5VXU3_9BACT|nr:MULTISPECIES: sigma-70 family RNA polymerase sigma factor [unclassified Labilibaculum]MDE5420234.1 sigma-70 family RNA polymerase sigma factor [Labilibaculum sp. DW002]